MMVSLRYTYPQNQLVSWHAVEVTIIPLYAVAYIHRNPLVISDVLDESGPSQLGKIAIWGARSKQLVGIVNSG